MMRMARTCLITLAQSRTLSDSTTNGRGRMEAVLPVDAKGYELPLWVRMKRSQVFCKRQLTSALVVLPKR